MCQINLQQTSQNINAGVFSRSYGFAVLVTYVLLWVLFQLYTKVGNLGYIKIEFSLSDLILNYSCRYTTSRNTTYIRKLQNYLSVLAQNVRQATTKQVVCPGVWCVQETVKKTAGDTTNCNADMPCDMVTNIPNTDHSACSEYLF